MSRQSLSAPTRSSQTVGRSSRVDLQPQLAPHQTLETQYLCGGLFRGSRLLEFDFVFLSEIIYLSIQTV